MYYIFKEVDFSKEYYFSGALCMLQNAGYIWSLKLDNSCKPESYILSLQATAGLTQQLDTLAHILEIKYSPVCRLQDPITWNAFTNQFQSLSL